MTKVQSIEEQARMHGFGSYPLIDVREDGLVGRYVATDSFADWSLRSDRLIRGSVAT